MLPGWDSLEATSAYPRWLTYAGFAALFLLGVFEVLGHVYSVHETTLRGAAVKADAKEQAEKNAQEKAAEQERTAKAERDLLELKKRQEPRQIGRIDGEKLIAALKTAQPKGSIDLTCVLGDGEGATFAEQLDKILKAGEWTTTGVSQAVYSGGNPVGGELPFAQPQRHRHMRGHYSKRSHWLDFHCRLLRTHNSPPTTRR